MRQVQRMKYGVVARNRPGENVSGDEYFFHQDPDSTLVALIDGLGSGYAAHEAAVRARECVAHHTAAPLPNLLERCHQAVHGTRGVVMMLMRVAHLDNTVSFAGIGNIGVRVLGDSDIKPLSRNGIVGYRMTDVHEYSYPTTGKEVFILHSDGISTRFDVDEEWACRPGTDLYEIAEEIADSYGKEDDVTVLVTRQA